VLFFEHFAQRLPISQFMGFHAFPLLAALFCWVVRHLTLNDPLRLDDPSLGKGGGTEPTRFPTLPEIRGPHRNVGLYEPIDVKAV
jgi:hypothetical protein